MENLNNCQKLTELYESSLVRLADLEREFLLRGAIIENDLDVLEKSLDKMPILLLRQNLEKDYQQAIDDLAFFGMLNEDKKSYNVRGFDLNLTTYSIPEFEEILTWITPEQIKQYGYMVERGLEPRLQINLIARDTRDIAQKIENVMHLGHSGEVDLSVYFEINGVRGDDTTFLYGADNDRLVNKDALIKEYEGVTVEIVPTRMKIRDYVTNGLVEAQRKIIDKSVGNAFDYYRDEGFQFFNRESFLFYLMRLIRENRVEEIGFGGRDNLEIPLKDAHFGLNNMNPNEMQTMKVFWNNGNLVFDLTPPEGKKIEEMAIPYLIRLKKPAV